MCGLLHSFFVGKIILGGVFMTKKLTTTGVLLALAVILSMIRLFDAPYGGSVTLASMLPIILLSVLYGTKWGILSGIVFSVLTMFSGGIPAPPVAGFGMYVLVVVLDYILAFGVLGFAGSISRLFSGKPYAVPLASAVVIALRFLCHFLSGILIWSAYAWEGYGAALYSFLYNGSYMLFELIITTILSALVVKWIPKK